MSSRTSENSVNKTTDSLRRLALGTSVSSVAHSSVDTPPVATASAAQPPRSSSPSDSLAWDSTVSTPGSLLLGRSANDGGGDRGKSSESGVPAVLCGGPACGSFVGKNVDVFCYLTNCTTRLHKSRKSPSKPTEDAFYILARKSNNTVFNEPFVKVGDATEEMVNYLSSGVKHSVEEWKIKFNEFNEEIRKNKASRPSEVVVKLEAIPLVKEELNISSNKGLGEDFENPQPEATPNFTGKYEDDLENIKDMCGGMLKICDELEKVAICFELVGEDMDEIVEEFGVSAKATNGLLKAIGDRNAIITRYNNVSAALDQLSTGVEEAVVGQEDLRANLEELDDKVVAMIANLQQTITTKLDLMKKGLTTQDKVSADSSRELFTDLMKLLFVEGRLNPEMEVQSNGHTATLGEMLDRLGALEKRMDDLEKRTENAESQLAARGGMRVGNFFYKSKKELRQKIINELPSASAFSCFVQALSMFGHSSNISNSDKAHYKKVNKEIPSTDAAVIEACCTEMCPPYTGSAKTYDVDKPIDAFRSRSVWKGVAGEGRKKMIVKEVKDCAARILGTINQQLDGTVELKGLAIAMLTLSKDFHSDFHEHLNDDETVLEALNLPEDDIMLLFSEVFRLIVQRWQQENASVHSLDAQTSPLDRLTELIWAAGRVHMLMQELQDAKFKHHPIVQSAFVRFLTRKTGEASAAGLVARIDRLSKEIDNVKTKTENAKRDAAAAKVKAQSAVDSVESLKKNPR